MGSDVAEVQEKPFDTSPIKVHQVICTQLLGLLKRIDEISKDIEEVRPRCTSGIEALCLLQNAREKAKEHIQNCRDSSKLYLALTGDKIVSRFEKTKNHLVRSLSELQNVVPVVLQQQIKEILYKLDATKFQLDLHEQEAGKALRALLEQDASVMGSFGNSDTEILQFAASMLQLTTQKDLLIERRAIQKQLDRVIEEKPPRLDGVMEEKSLKEKTLKYLFYLLKKNKALLLQGQHTNPSDLHNVPALSMMSSGKSRKPKRANVESHPRYGPLENPANMLIYALIQTPANMLDRSNPPEEFICPLSSQLMSDPVVIASGQTFERTHIQKWFDDGNKTCPITRLTLADQSLRPNSAMKDLISKWLAQHGTHVSDSNMQNLDVSSISIRSNASSLRDLNLQIDISNVSIGSLDSSYSSGFSNPKPKIGLSSLRGSSKADSCKYRFYRSTNEIRLKVLSNVNDLPWESRCKAVQDVKDYFIEYNPSCTFVSSENFLEPLVKFLNEALKKPDVEAQKAGVQLLLAFLKSDREEAVNISEDVHTLLASLLRTDYVAETLAILEALSSEAGALSSLTASGALPSIIELLDSSNNNRELQGAAIRILYTLSLSIDVHSMKPDSSWIPKLVPFLRDSSVAGTCIGILENLSKFEAGRVSIVHTDGCIASIVELLEAGSSEAQERAIAVLLSLCLQRESYCRLVLHEGALPPLYQVSDNGSDKVKISASELLRQLMDVKTESEVQQPKLQNNVVAGRTNRYQNFGRKIKTFFRMK